MNFPGFACPTRNLAFLLLGLFLAGTAQAEWLAIGRNEEYRAYLDQSSLQKNGDFVRAFQMVDFVTAQWADERTVIGSIRTLVEYDCKQRRSRALSVDAYSEQMGQGRRVAAENVPEPSWEPVQPRSTSERIWQLVCGK